MPTSTKLRQSKMIARSLLSRLMPVMFLSAMLGCLGGTHWGGAPASGDRLKAVYDGDLADQSVPAALAAGRLEPRPTLYSPSAVHEVADQLLKPQGEKMEDRPFRLDTVGQEAEPSMREGDVTSSAAGGAVPDSSTGQGPGVDADARAESDATIEPAPGALLAADAALATGAVDNPVVSTETFEPDASSNESTAPAVSRNTSGLSAWGLMASLSLSSAYQRSQQLASSGASPPGSLAAHDQKQANSASHSPPGDSPGGRLVVRNGRLCTTVYAAGQYDEIPGNRLRPGQTALVYCELASYLSVSLRQADRTVYVTRLQGGATIRDSQGNALHRYVFAPLEDVADEPRSEFYLHMRIEIPELSPGPYSLEVDVEDLHNGHSARLEPPIGWEITDGTPQS